MTTMMVMRVALLVFLLFSVVVVVATYNTLMQTFCRSETDVFFFSFSFFHFFFVCLFVCLFCLSCFVLRYFSNVSTSRQSDNLFFDEGRRNHDKYHHRPTRF